MSYTTFNGWNVIPLPTTPTFSQISFSMNDSVAVVQSWVSMQSQVQAWPGADYWQLQLALPPMQRANAQKWRAFLGALRGKQNVFQLGDPLSKTPLGVSGGTPVADGAHLSMSTLLNVRGLPVSTANVYLPGDNIQIGVRLHYVVQPVNSNGAGKAQIEIWPSIREAPNDGDAIVVSNTKGLFRLTGNTREWSVSVNKTYAFAFTAVEAR